MLGLAPPTCPIFCILELVQLMVTFENLRERGEREGERERERERERETNKRQQKELETEVVKKCILSSYDIWCKRNWTAKF